MSLARCVPLLFALAACLAASACARPVLLATDGALASAAIPAGYDAAPAVLPRARESSARAWCTTRAPAPAPSAGAWTFPGPSVQGPLARLAPGAVAPSRATRSGVAWVRTGAAAGPTRAGAWGAASPADPGGAPPSVCDDDAYREALRLCCARRKSNTLAIGGCAAILAYGLAFWDYGSNPFHFRDDGLYGEETDYGGADKAGHMVAAGIQTAVFSGINRSFGLSRKESAARGALTAFLVMGMIEIGDGFTKVHGFTYGDLLTDALGCVFGYFHESSPWFQRTFDLRWEYWPTDQVLNGEDLDISSDYDGSSYVLAMNVGSVIGRPRSLLDLVDVQLGYNSRNYADLEGDPERNVFIGVGPNLSNLCRRIGWRVPAKIFEYYQVPGISLRFTKNLND